MKIYALIAAIPLITACGVNVVSPSMGGKEGVEYGIGHKGYPSVDKVSFKISSSDVDKARHCILSNIDHPERGDVEINGSTLTTSASSSYDLAGFARAFRYTLLADANSGVYSYSRLYYTNDAGIRTFKVMASKYWSPENLYSELKHITDNIDSCLN